jgi:hypothetical protein
LPRRLRDLVAAHIGDQVDTASELGRIGVLRDQVGDKRLGLGIELRLLRVLQRHQSARLFRRNRRDRFGRGQRHLSGLGYGRRHAKSSSLPPR